MTGSVTRRWLAGALAALAGAVSLSAVTAPTVKFSDTRLKNGLRVIVSEDHAAPVFSVAYGAGTLKGLWLRLRRRRRT